MALALSELQHRGRTVAVSSGANVTNWLADIQTAMAVATYDDGGTVAGSAQAWSVGATEGTPVEAVCLHAPSSGVARVLFAGYNGAKTPTMLTPDTAWLANAPWIQVGSNGGALATWDGATPLGAAPVRNTSFWKAGPTLGGAAGKCMLFQSEETVALAWLNGTNYGLVFAGAIVDPCGHSTAESNGRLYGMITAGNASLFTDFWSNGNSFGEHGTSNGNPHGCLMTPGASSISVISRFGRRQAAMTAAAEKAPGGEYMFTPIGVRYATWAADGAVAGVLRGVYCGPRAAWGTAVTVGGRRYVAISGSSSAVDALWFGGASA